MVSAPLPPDENERLDALRSYRILDTATEPGFDDLTQLAAEIMGTPIALVSLVDANRQWFKSHHGLDATETPRELAFCAHAVSNKETLVVPDASKDPRFHDNPLVASAPNIRFYAGVPLLTAEGYVLGTLCTIDKKPRHISSNRLESLRRLGRQVVAQLELRKARDDARIALINAQQLESESRALLDGATEYAIIALTHDGHISRWNVGAERLLGYSASEIIGQHYSRFYSDIDIDTNKPQRNLELAAAAGRHVEELIRIRKDGSLFVAHVIITPIYGQDGIRSGFVKIMRDVTERHNLVERLAAANARFVMASKAAGIGVWEYDIEHKLLQWDEQMFRLYGHRLSDGVQPYNLWSSSLHPDDIERCQLEIEEAEHGGRPFDTEFRIIHRDGRIRWIKAAAGITTDVMSNYRHMIGINIDITELRESRDFLQRIENASRVGGFVLDVTTGKFNRTKQALKIYEMPDDIEPAPGAIEALYSSQAYASLRDAIDTAIKTATGIDVTLPVSTAKGRSIWVRISGTAEQRGERVIRLVGTIEDVTERRLQYELLRVAKNAAETANLAKSEFLANMSHEIRTPLNAVIGLGYILDQTQLSEDQRQLLTKIQFAGRTLLSVVNNVLDLSKIEAGEMKLENEPFEPIGLVQDVCQMLAPQANAKNVQLITLSASKLPETLLGDGQRLRQVLINLINNAVKFTESGQIEVSTSLVEAGSDWLRLRCEIKDSGIGIDPNKIQQLFSPFAQADASTTRRFGGTGLGLSIARQLVELMGGEIGVTSEIGKGSNFWFEVPLRLSELGTETWRTHVASGLRVVVVDPKGDVPDGLGQLARQLGWNVISVDTGQQVMDMLHGTPLSFYPDVFVLRQHLPDMSATQLVTRLLAETGYGDTPPVIVAADMASAYLEEEFNLRATDVLLLPPIATSVLFNAVNSVVSRTRAGRERILQSTKIDELNARWLSGVRVLVVDDSDVNREVAKRILHKHGAIIATCVDGAKAVEYVRQHHAELDAVLMDVQMPVMDGNEATRLIRSELQLTTLPIIALTAGALVGERMRCLDSGMTEVVTKPFDPNSLIRIVRRAVEQATGQQLPLVMGEPETTEVTPLSDLPAAIDSRVVKQMFGDDFSLFGSLLNRMLRDYADWALPIQVPNKKSKERAALQARAHKLKGTAGMVGAVTVMKWAGVVESALELSRPTQDIEAVLGELAAALTTLAEQSRAIMTEQTDAKVMPNDSVVGTEKISATQYAELYSLIDAHNLAALDKFSDLAPALGALIGAVRLSHVREAMDSLDFPLAARLLRHAPEQAPDARKQA